jgi:hypothetical protein
MLGTWGRKKAPLLSRVIKLTVLLPNSCIVCTVRPFIRNFFATQAWPVLCYKNIKKTYKKFGLGLGSDLRNRDFPTP